MGNDQLKNISQIEHTLHRSPVNFLINLLSGLIAYCHQKKKPSLPYQNIFVLLVKTQNSGYFKSTESKW